MINFNLKFLTACAVAAATLLPGVSNAQSADWSGLTGGGFTVDALGPETSAGFHGSAVGTSNGVGWTAIPFAGASIFAGFTNLDGDATFNDLSGSMDALHVGSDVVLIFEQRIQALVVATANDNATGDGFDFGAMPIVADDIQMTGTFMGATDAGGTMALIVLPEPTAVWVSESDDTIADGTDIAFFAFPSWPPN